MPILFFFLFFSLTLATGDEGSGIDPNGGRVTGQGDRGPGMDPWG